jgi:hypothetical protein
MEYQGKAVTINPNRARVRLNNKCVLVLNRVAHQRLGSPEAVVLLYDPRYRVVGLRAASPDRSNAFPLKQRYKKGSNGSTGMLAIYATDFSSSTALSLNARSPLTIRKSKTVSWSLISARRGS